MFRSLFVDPVETGSLSSEGTARRRVMPRIGRPQSLWAVAAITLLTLGTLSVPAPAQIVRDHRGQTGRPGTGTIGGGGASPAANTASKPMQVFLVDMYCEDESNDDTWPLPDHDEPYAIVFAADLRGATPKANIYMPTADNVDTGETHVLNRQIWSLTYGQGSPIDSANDYVFLVALMEEDRVPWGDSAAVDYIWSQLNRVMLPKLQAYKQQGLSRPAMISNLRADMTQAIDSTRRNDDRIGEVYDIVWTPSSLNTARAGQPVDLLPRFVGSDSSYRLRFRLQ